MEPEFDNRNAPSYLAHYGMHRPPFATKTDDDMYYAEPTRNKRLDILLHLTQYGNELLLVTGAEGSGKTTLMHQFTKKAQSNWRVCSLNAHTKMDEEQLLYRICHSFNLAVESGALPFIVTNVKRQLDQMLAASQTVVLVIDNAHILSPAVLALLAEFSKIKNQQSGTYLRIILFAEPQIKIQFATIELENKLKFPVRKIDLPPFDELQTGELIRHRTKTAGLEADNTFTDAAISKIYKQSEGIPGNIVDLSHRVLFEMTPLKRRTKTTPVATPEGAKTKPPIGLIAGVVGIVIIALILMFQNEINNLYFKKTEQPASEERTVTSLAIPKLPAESANNDIEQAHIKSAANNNTANEKTENFRASSKTIAVFAKDIDSNTVQAPASASGTNLSEADSSESVSSIAPTISSKSVNTEPRSTATTRSSQSNKEVRNEGKNESAISQINLDAWLLEQNPNYFTLQLVAGYQKSTVNNFLKLHKLPNKQLAYYHSLNKGKDWNSLVYGVYPDYRSAMLALDDLPSAVRKARPWIRQLKSIQAEIKEAKQ